MKGGLVKSALNAFLLIYILVISPISYAVEYEIASDDSFVAEAPVYTGSTEPAADSGTDPGMGVEVLADPTVPQTDFSVQEAAPEDGKQYGIASSPNVTIEKTFLNGPVSVNGTLMFAINLTNIDSSNLSEGLFYIADSYNTTLMVYNNSDATPDDVNGSTGQILWAVPELEPDDSYIIIVNFTALIEGMDTNDAFLVNDTGYPFASDFENFGIGMGGGPGGNPNITVGLMSPAEGSSAPAPSNITFRANVTSTDDGQYEVNCTLWWNVSGTWQPNGTYSDVPANISIVSVVEWNRSTNQPGSYVWNVKCIDKMSGMNSAFAAQNRTFSSVPAISCGDTITSSRTLADDLTCSGDGIIIGANNIVLDCGGHSITGDYSGDDYGVRREYSVTRDNVTIKNCNISGFSVGIMFGYSTGTTIENNYIHHNNVSSSRGISVVDDATDFVIRNNNISENGYIGMDFTTGGGSISGVNITGNRILRHTEYGIRIRDLSSSNVRVWNNYFNNTPSGAVAEIYENGSNSKLNYTITAGTNIIGGGYIGGNYWVDYAGSDNNLDGIGDTEIPYNSSLKVFNAGGDYLPLVSLPPQTPVQVTLAYPASGSNITSSSFTLNYTVNVPSNCTQYWNYTGGWTQNANASGNGSLYVDVSGISNGEYKWNVYCAAQANASNNDWADANWTFSVNYTAPPSFGFYGWAHYPNGTNMSGVNASVEIYNFTFAGPVLLQTVSANTDSGGWFNLSLPQAQGPDEYMYAPALVKMYPNGIDAQYINKPLPMLDIEQLQAIGAVDFYLKDAATLNLTAFNTGGDTEPFQYILKDSSLNYHISSFTEDYLDSKTVYVMADRNYSLIMYFNQTMPVQQAINNISSYGSPKHIDLSFNVTDQFVWVSGYARLEGGAPDITTLDVLGFIIEPGNVISSYSMLPHNMSAWRMGPFTDVFNPTTGFYNMTLVHPMRNLAVMLLFIGYDNSDDSYYLAYQNITIGPGTNSVSGFNVSLRNATGSTDTDFELDNGAYNVTAQAVNFTFRNASGAPVDSAFVMATMDISSIIGMDVVWTQQLTEDDSGTMTLPLIDGYDVEKLQVFSSSYAPKKRSVGSALLNMSVVTNMTAFNPGPVDSGEFNNTDIFIDMIKDTPECNRPNYPANCSFFPNGDVNFSLFNPFKLVIGGGDLSFVIRRASNNITIIYTGTDLLASGPPDAMFDGSADASTVGAAIEEAWRFGSQGPDIYDQVIIGFPYNRTIDANTINITLPYLYDEDWNLIWNVSANGTGGLDTYYPDYAEFNDSWFTGMDCDESDYDADCYVDDVNYLMWMHIPHFSGFKSTISGTQNPQGTPPTNITVRLMMPVDGNTDSPNATITFSANVTSDVNTTFNVNCSLWWNVSGTWESNGTHTDIPANATAVSAFEWNRSTNQPGSYVWNVKCAQSENESVFEFAEQNRTLVSTASAPEVNYTLNFSGSTSVGFTVGSNNYTVINVTNGDDENRTYNFSVQFNSTGVNYTINMEYPSFDNVTLQANESLDFTINFTATSAGIREAYLIATMSNDSSVTLNSSDDIGAIVVNVSAAAINNPVSYCTALDQPNTYYTLIADLQANGSNCLNITADNVTIDGNGYGIQGNHTSSVYGIYADSRKNITIKNFMSISHFYDGIQFNSTNNSLIINNTIISCSRSGIYLRTNSTNNAIELNNVLDTNNVTESPIPFGIVLYQGSSHNTIRNNIIQNTSLISSGSGILLSTSTEYNMIENNSLSSNRNGIIILSNTCKHNTLLNNQISGSTYLGGSEISDSGYPYNYLIYNNSFGEIRWHNWSVSGQQQVNGGLNFPGNITIGNNFAYFNSAAFAGQRINSSSNVTLRGIGDRGFVVPSILKDGVLCGSECHNFTNLTADTVVFNVTSWSNYTIGEGDQSAPQINFSSPTETSGATVTRNYLLVNATASDTGGSGLKNITVRLYNSNHVLVNSTNSTTSPLYINFANLADGRYFFNATACDNVGLCNSAETRNVTTEVGSNVTICRELNSPNTVYVLQNNIGPNMAGGCFNITASNVTLDGNGKTIDGNDGGSTYVSSGIIIGQNLTNVTVRDFAGITDFYHGIYMNSTSHSSISNNTASSNVKSAIKTGTEAYVSNTAISGNRLASNGEDGMYIHSGFNVTILNNTIFNNSHEGIETYNSFINSTIQRNNVTSNLGDGIYMYYTVPRSGNNTISDNWIISNGHSAYYSGINTGGVYDTIENNMIISNFGIGIWIWMHHETIRNNTIRGHNNTGVYIYGDANTNSNLVEQNQISGNNNGVWITGGDGSNIFLNNNITNSSAFAINDTVTGDYNYLIYNNSFGEIKWRKTNLTTAGEISFPGNITISNNSAQFNPAGMAAMINSSANVTLRGMQANFTNPVIYRDGNLCNQSTTPSCHNFTGLNATTVIFNVSSWSTYTIGEAALTDSVPPQIHSSGVANPDYFFSPYDNIVNITVNATDDTGVTHVYANFSQINSSICGSGMLNLTLASGLYAGSCNVGTSISAGQYPTAYNVTVYAGDGTSYNHTVLSQPLLLHDMGVPSIGESCLRFGSGTTNFTEETDFSDINFIVEVQMNKTCRGIPNSTGEYETVTILNVSSVDISTQSAAMKLSGMGTAMQVNITGHNQFGTNRIYINTTYFAELDSNTTISMFNLPFTSQPAITAENISDQAGITGVTWSQFAGQNASGSCSFDSAEANCAAYGGNPVTCESARACDFFGPATCSNNATECSLHTNSSFECEAFTGCDWSGTDEVFASGNLTFTVPGFSGYNMADNATPTISVHSPVVQTNINPPVVNLTVNGTGTEPSVIIIKLDNQTKIYNSTVLGPPTNTAQCSAISYGSDTFRCTFQSDYTLTNGTYALNVTAYDYGGSSPGNSAQSNSTFQVGTIAQPTQPNMTISKSDSSDTVKVGGTITYTITYNNSGGTATNVTINETYPSQVTFVSASPSPNTSNNQWIFSNVSSGGSGVISVNVTVNSGTGNGTVLVNNVTLDYLNSTNASMTQMYDTETTTAVGDSYEYDDNYTTANWINVAGVSQQHTISTAGDQDWVKFNATSGARYVIQTHDILNGADTLIALYGTDGTTNISQHDDILSGLIRRSRINWTAPANGTYFVKVRDWNASHDGGVYNISIRELPNVTISLITPTVSTSVQKGSLFNFSVNVSCLGVACNEISVYLDPEESVPEKTPSYQAQADSANLLTKLDSLPDSEYDVIVVLKDAAAMPAPAGYGIQAAGKISPVEQRKKEVGANQDAALSSLGISKGPKAMGAKSAMFTLGRKYSVINAFSGRMTKAGLAALRNNPNVESVQLDGKMYPTLDNSVPKVNATAVWATQYNGVNITGTGQTVCVIDTGINYSHPDFGGYGTFPNAKVVGGYDYVNDDSVPQDEGGSWPLCGGHGSHVAGTVASMDATYKGVAPGANIAMVKVFGNSGGSCVGDDSDIVAAIDWCVYHAQEYNISVISMSLGDGTAWQSNCNSDMVAQAVNYANSLGFIVAIATGNEAYTNGISAPACASGALAVGATTIADARASFSNYGELLDVWAPGVDITSTSWSGGHTDKDGTSMATPHVAGAAALLSQYYALHDGERLHGTAVTSAIMSSGPVVTGVNISRRRLEVNQALSVPLQKGVISTTPGATPFYTVNSNPYNISVSANNWMQLSWMVNATGNYSTYRFFAFTTITGDDSETESQEINITIQDTSYPMLSIVSPANGAMTNSPAVSFTFNVTDTFDTTFNCSLYINGALNETNASVAKDTLTMFSKTLASGNYTYNISCLDGYGNVNNSGARSITVDTAGPTTNLTSITNGTYYSANVTVTLAATDAVSGINHTTYRIDGGAWANYSTPVPYGTEGTHTIYYYSVDNAGNTETTRNATFTIDLTSPQYYNFSSSSADVNTSSPLYIFANWTESNPAFAVLKRNGTITNTTALSSFVNFTWIPSASDAEKNFTFSIWANDSAGRQNETYNITVRVLDTSGPTVSLIQPENDTTTNNSTIIFRVNATDNLGSVANCSLYLNNIYNSTITGVTSGAASSFPAVELEDGQYLWNAVCYDGSGNAGNSTQYLLEADTEAPLFFSPSLNPANDTQYSPGRTHYFNITANDSLEIDSVWISFNGTNYTAASTGQVYMFNTTDLPAGTYDYAWYANDSAGNTNSTGVIAYSVLRATAYCSLNISPSSPATYNQTVTANCSCTNQEASASLSRNSTDITVLNNVASVTAAGSYNFTCTVPQTQNYTSAQNSSTYTVNPGTPVLTITTLPSPTVTYGTYSNVSCSANTPQATPQLYRNGTAVNASGDYAILGASTYNYTCNSTAVQNYSAGFNTTALTVNKAASTVNLTINGQDSDANVELNSNATISGAIIGFSDTVTIYKNGTSLQSGTSPLSINHTFDTLGVYNITVLFNGSANYTSSQETHLVTVTPDATKPSVTGIAATPSSINQTQTTNITAVITDNVAVSNAYAQVTFPNTTTANYSMQNSSSTYYYAFTTTLAYPKGAYSVRIFAVDNNSNWNSTETTNFSVSDVTAPAYSGLTEPADPSTYSAGAIHQFNATWTDNLAVSAVWINWAGTDYYSPQVSGSGDTYSFNRTALAAGTYNYTWYSNDTSGNTNYTPAQAFTVSRISSVCSLVFSQPSITYNATVNASCTCTNTEASAVLYRNGTDVTSTENNQPAVIGAGSHSYNCTVSQTQNYTSAQNSSTYTVNPGTPVLTITTLPSPIVTYGTYSNVSCSANTPQATPQLYRNGTNVSNPDYSLLGATVYNYTCNSTAVQNYSAGYNTTLLTVSRSADSVNMTLNGYANQNISVTYPATVTAYGYSNSSTDQVWRNGTLVTEGGAETLGAGMWAYTVNSTGNSNYTSNSTGLTYWAQVNRTISTTALLLNGSAANLSASVDSQINITAYISTPASGSMTLYDNGNSINSGASPLTNMTSYPSEGTHNITAVYGETQNYSASSSTLWVIVQDLAAPNVTLLSPANNAWNTTLAQAFRYYVNDTNSGISNCSLYVDGAIKLTNTSVTEGNNQFNYNVSPGTHTWYARCHDNSTNRNAASSSTWTTKIDNLAPSTSIAGVANGTSYSTYVTISLGRTDTDSGVNYTSYNISGSWQNYTSAFNYSTEGTHTIIYYSVDNAGNTETAKSTTFTIDTTGPALTITSPQEGANISGTTDFNVTSAAASHVIFRINSTNLTDDLSSPFSYALNTMLYTDGTYILRATAYDSLGNSNSTNVTVLIDNTAPVSSITYPSNNYLTNAAWVVVNGTASDAGTGVASVQIKNGTAWHTATGTTTWYRNISFTSAGIISVQSMATDNKGNAETPAAGINIIFDNVAPSISGVSMNPNPASNATSVSVSATVTDTNGVAAVNATLNGTITALTQSGSTWSGTITSPAAEGTYNLTITARDNASNTALDSSYQLVVNATAPIITISPVNGSVVASGSQINISASNAATSLYNTTTSPTLTAFTNSTNVNATGADGATFTVYVTANSSGGATSTMTNVYTIDNAAPAVYINAVTTPTSSASQNVSGNVTESNLNRVEVNGMAATVVGSNWYRVVSLTEGNNSVTAAAYDNAGQSGSSTTYIVRDTSAPATSYSLSGTAGTSPWYTSNVAVTLTANESGATTKYCTGAACSPSTTYSSAVTISTEGATTFRYNSYDAAGNNESVKEITISIDKTAPSVSTPNVSTISPVTNEALTISASMSDTNALAANQQFAVINGTSYQMTLLSGSTYRYEFTPTQAGYYSYYVYANDAAGNTAASATGDFTVGVKASDTGYSFQNDSSNERNYTGTTDTYVQVNVNQTVSGNITVILFSTQPDEVNSTLSNAVKYVSINVSQNVNASLEWILLKIYYTDSEITALGLDESTLSAKWYDPVANTWITLSAGSPSWVHGTGVDTTNNYVWANISHLSVFAFSGSLSGGGDTGGGGGGGGGGGVTSASTFNVPLISAGDTSAFNLVQGNKVTFVLGSMGYTYRVDSMTGSVLKIKEIATMESTYLFEGVSKDLDIDGDGRYDVSVLVTYLDGLKATVAFTALAQKKEAMPIAPAAPRKTDTLPAEEAKETAEASEAKAEAQTADGSGTPSPGEGVALTEPAEPATKTSALYRYLFAGVLITVAAIFFALFIFERKRKGGDFGGIGDNHTHSQTREPQDNS